MKFPRLAETLSSVDFAIRPSIAKDADAQDISVADTSKSPRADIDIVGRAESEALRQDERLQTIIKSSVDKLKGDLSRLKKPASGTSHGSASTSSSQGPERSLPIPARSKESDPKPAAEGANTVSPPHGDVAPSSAGQGKASSEHVASQFGTDSVLPAKTLLAVPGSGMSETYTAPEVVQGSSALRASPKLLPLATAHDDLVPKDKEEAEAEKPSPAKEATHEIEEGEQERLSMSFFAGVAQVRFITRGALWRSPDGHARGRPTIYRERQPLFRPISAKTHRARKLGNWKSKP
ncbi:hypothetical protein DFJ74DRAFT_170614 [Hyaloraphidium curvatum]|nr:hypothetical protein DFJ74DRAFT_170614 [Hyaloraphidium curvatum]